MDNTHITISHNGVDIVYDEQTNKFVFTLRGHERAVGSLRAAKDAIDKPVKEVPTFEPIDAYYEDYMAGRVPDFKPCKVTSIAVNGYGEEVWITSAAGRRKYQAYKVFPATPHNTKIIEQLPELRAALHTVQSRVTKAIDGLRKFVVPQLPKDGE